MGNFLNSGALWWLAAALPPIVLMYFLKLRRTEQVVSSTLLWRRSVYDLRVNAPFQRIRKNLLLLLQLLVATLVILALARPFANITRASGSRAALIIDCSASMAATDEDGGKSRLEVAKSEAIKIVNSLGVKNNGAASADELCVIAAAERPILLCGLSSSKDRLRSAIESIRVHATETDMNAALEMAIAVTGVQHNLDRMRGEGEAESDDKASDAKPNPAPRGKRTAETRANVIVLSDGGFGKVPDNIAQRLTGSSFDGGGSRYVRFGNTKVGNVGIVAVSAGADIIDRSERKIFVRLENTGAAEKNLDVRIRLAGEFHDMKPVTVPAAKTGSERSAGSAGVVFGVPATFSGIAEIDFNGDDVFPLDDRVTTVLKTQGKMSVLLVSEGNFFLENALSADRMNISLDKMKPSAYPASGQPRTESGADYELIIYDRYAPKDTPQGASLYIGAAPELPDVTLHKERPTLYAAAVLDWNRTHPLMRNIKMLDRIGIYKSLNISFGGGWSGVIAGEGVCLENEEDLKDAEKLKAAPVEEATLLGCLVSESRRVAVLAFDIFHTERWPMRISFPLFVYNATHWLARPGGMQKAIVYHTGDTLRASFDEDIKTVDVLSPSGRKYAAAISGKRKAYFSNTDEVGVYRMIADDNELGFACNLLSSDESDIASRTQIIFGEEVITASAAEKRRNMELWQIAALAALALLLLEWYVFNRRIVA